MSVEAFGHTSTIWGLLYISSIVFHFGQHFIYYMISIGRMTLWNMGFLAIMKTVMMMVIMTMVMKRRRRRRRRREGTTRGKLYYHCHCFHKSHDGYDDGDHDDDHDNDYEGEEEKEEEKENCINVNVAKEVQAKTVLPLSLFPHEPRRL